MKNGIGIALADPTTLVVTYLGHEYRVALDIEDGRPFYDPGMRQPASLSDVVLDLLDDCECDVETTDDAIRRLFAAFVEAERDGSYETLHGYRVAL